MPKPIGITGAAEFGGGDYVVGPHVASGHSLEGDTVWTAEIRAPRYGALRGHFQAKRRPLRGSICRMTNSLDK